jgi:hypothetical protein
MPTKIDPKDWDRLFAPNAPKRGGPLRIFITLVLLGAVLGGLTYGTLYAIDVRTRQVNDLIATATSIAETAIPAQTASALMVTQTAQTLSKNRTATAIARATPVDRVIGTGTVNRGGNLRSEPRIAADTLLGLIWPGDQIEFLEPREVGDQLWYRIRIVQLAPDRGGAGVPAKTEGWAAASLLSTVTPTP